MANRGFFWDGRMWARLREDGILCGVCGILDCVCERTLVELLPILRPETLEEPQEPESPSSRRSNDSYPSDSPTEAAGDPYLVPEEVPEQLCCN